MGIIEGYYIFLRPFRGLDRARESGNYIFLRYIVVGFMEGYDIFLRYLVLGWIEPGI